MRPLIYLLAVSIGTIAWSSAARAQDPCTASLAMGTFAFTSIHFNIKGSGATASYVPTASSGVLYFDGVSAMQFQSVEYTGTGSPENFSGTGTYTVGTLNLSLSPPGTTDVCLLSVTVNGKTVTYYLDTAGQSYYGVDSSKPKTIVSVQANRVS
jgi:hypothetical protein